MSDSLTDERSMTTQLFFSSSADIFFLKFMDASDAVKNIELYFTYLDAVVEEIRE